jgi:DNA-binding MarR family transcriptional regulator
VQATTEALLVAFWRMSRTLKRSHTGPIEPALWWVLHTLACDGPGRLSELAAHLQLDLSTVSRHVRALEDAGYLERTTDPNDRRATVISMTDKGTDALEEAGRARAEHLDTVLARWSERDLRTLRRLLDRLADDLNAHLDADLEADLVNDTVGTPE